VPRLLKTWQGVEQATGKEEWVIWEAHDGTTGAPKAKVYGAARA
jgi:hypothetical protein